jgi:hypothetical protein
MDGMGQGDEIVSYKEEILRPIGLRMKKDQGYTRFI